MEAQRRLAARYAATYPEEAARRLDGVPSPEVAEFLADIEPATAVAVVEKMLPSSAAAALGSMAHTELSLILERLPEARCVLVLRAVPKPDRNVMVGLLPGAAAARVEGLLRSSEGSAGELAEPVPAVLAPGMDVDEALRVLEETSKNYAYVVDGDHRLVGVVHRRDLSKSDRRTRIDGLIVRKVVKLPSAASLAAVRNHQAWFDFETLPVVDASGVLVGAIRHRSVRRASSVRPASVSLPRRAALEAFLDLGEVYWTGLASALEALGTRGRGARVAEVKSDS